MKSEIDCFDQTFRIFVGKVFLKSNKSLVIFRLEKFFQLLHSFDNASKTPTLRTQTVFSNTRDKNFFSLRSTFKWWTLVSRSFIQTVSYSEKQNSSHKFERKTVEV